ncbi:MAG TPA: ATP-binding protein [Kineosporiaceae bacterium]|nr:ATP-binding protein [Kineosporiaceae bacterium]
MRDPQTRDPQTRDPQTGEDDAPLAGAARVLGQLLAAQNVLPALPTPQRVSEFYAVALATVPGVRGARVCLGQVRSEAGDITPDACPACPACPAESPGSRQVPPVPLPRSCLPADRPGVQVLPLRTLSAAYGFFVIHIDDPAAYRQYAPFIANIGSFLALWLENRAQQATVRQARDALEQRVQERTAQLRETNLRLQSEIEERRHDEATIRQLNEDLDQRVRERTQELQDANQELESFAYSVSHDLRAPLRHILGFADALRETAAGSLDEQQLHCLEAITQSGRRMQDMVQDLLSFSRAGRAALVCRPVDLRILTDEVISEFEPETRGRAIRWHLGELPVVNADQAMLRLVLVNLIGNAVKFTRARTPAEITVGQQPSTAAEIVIAVRDNGIGFDMAHAARLFGVFERLHAASFEGNGIGLANVRRIIERHGGRVWADAAVDQGATFSFSLPCRPGDLPAGSPTGMA